MSAVVGAGMGLLCLCFPMAFLRKRVIAWEAEQNRCAPLGGFRNFTLHLKNPEKPFLVGG